MPSEEHCQFFAKYHDTTIAVEVKSRHRPGVLHTPGTADPDRLFTGRGIEPLLNRALHQQPGDRPFLLKSYPWRFQVGTSDRNECHARSTQNRYFLTAECFTSDGVAL